MTQSVGSRADLPCPKCRSPHVKVALTTDEATFYRCSTCMHAWPIPTPKQAPASPRARRRQHKAG